MIKTRTPEELAKLNLPTFEDLVAKSKKLDEDIKEIDEKIRLCKESPIYYFDGLWLSLIPIREELVEKQRVLQYKYDLMSKAFMDGVECQKHCEQIAAEEKEREQKQKDADSQICESNRVSISLCEEALDNIRNAKTLSELKLALIDAFE